MRRVVTAQLAACAIAFSAVRASADENPQPPPPPSSAQASPRTTVSTTVVVTAPIVATGHLIPDLFISLFALGAEVAAIHAIDEHNRQDPPVADRTEPLGQYSPGWHDMNAYRRKHDA